MKTIRSRWLALLISTLISTTSLAVTFTVTNTLDSGLGSLRAAITLANGTGSGTNLIQFNIPGTNAQTITLASALPAITRPVIIDGYTQPGAHPNTNSLANGFSGALQIELNGANTGVVGLRLLNGGSSGSTIRGLVINRCGRGVLISSSSNNVVEGCFIGVNPAGASAQLNDLGIFIEFDGGGNISSFNRIGGTNAAARNVISGNNVGVFVQSGTNNVVQGNLIGTDATGTNGLANSTGVSLAASDTLIGGTNVAARNIIAGGFSGIFVGHVTGTRIQGNLIGTDSTGSKALGLSIGIQLDSTASATQIGGPTATPGAPPGNVVTSSSQGSFAIAVGVSEGGGDRNIIQGNLVCTDATGRNPLGNARFGIANYGAFNLISSNVISGSVGEAGLFMGGSVSLVHDNLVQGNFIGPDITGTNLIGNAGNGIWVLLATSNSIQANVIAGNHGQGVYIDNPGTTAQAVLGNSIFANAGLGILLGSGANNSQTNPVITSAATGLGNVSLGGSLKSGSNAVYHLEFFSNASCDGSGFGEGQVFLGATNLTTDSNGNVSFTVILLNPAGHANFTATATDTNGNSSAFSPCASVSGPCNVICPSNMVVSTAANQCGAVVNFVPTTTGNCGAVNSSPPSGSFFPKGTNIVTCTSASGTNCSFTIAVIDTVAPSITCPANMVTNVPQAQTNAVVNYPAPAVTDNCGVASTNCSPASGSLFPLGTTTVTCTATDTASNANTCSFTVTVAHTNIPPVAACRSVTANANGSCQGDVLVTDVDNGSFDSDGTITNLTLSPPGPYPKGTNAVTFTVVDNLGASNSCAASIIVLDTTPPGIACPANIVTNLPVGQASAVVTYPPPFVFENCPGGTNFSIPSSGSAFGLGTTVVTCRAIDAAGNSNSCTFTVTVNATFTWSGGGANAFWTNAANWVGNVVPVSGARLAFPAGAARLNNTNDLNGRTFDSLRFETNGYTLNGNTITVTSGIVASNHSGINTVNLGVTFPGTQTVANYGTNFGQLNFNEANSIAGNLFITGSGAVNFFHSHVTSGAGGMTFQNTAGCTLDGTNTYTGPTEVQTGALSVGTSSSLGATGTGTTVRNGATLAVSGVADIAEPLVLEGALENADDPNIWRGPITLNGANVEVTVVAGSLTVSGAISGTNGLATHNFDQLRFTGTNTYTGVTRVAEGVLLVDGLQPASPILLDGGTLGGTGTVGVITSSATGGTLSPGSSPGILNCGGLALSAGATNLVELNGTTAGSGYDQVNVTGTVNLSNSVLKMVLGFTPAVGNSFAIIQNDGADAVAGTFSGLPNGALFTNSGVIFAISYSGGNGNDVIVTRVSSALSVPAAIPLSSGSYSQDFNSLAASLVFNGHNWIDGFTLPGWFAARSNAPTAISTYLISDGGDVTGALYSFGASGNGERALGSIASGTTETIGFGLCFTNDTALSASNFTVTYTGEQWRNGSTSVTNTLTFWYRVSATALTNPEPGTATGWTQVTSLDFASPTVLTNGTKLDGNQATNRHTFSTVLVPGLVVSPGQNVFFRWLDINDASNDDGMAVDDLTVTFSLPSPRITSISSSNGVAQLTGLGEANATYGIEAASNLNVPIFWQRIGSNAANGAGVFQFTDTNAPAFPMRFYRALSP